MTIRKVLVVDDSATDLKKLEQIVSEAGYVVITARSGKEANVHGLAIRDILLLVRNPAAILACGPNLTAPVRWAWPVRSPGCRGSQSNHEQQSLSVPRSGVSSRL